MLITVGAKCWNGDRKKSLTTEKIGSVSNTTPLIVDAKPQVKFRLNDPKLKAIIGYGIPLALLANGLPPISLGHAVTHYPSDEAIPAMSMAVGDALKSKIIHAFDPLIDLIVTLSYPIAGVMIAGGCLMIMVQQRERGMSMLQNAAIGYILVQLSPMLLNLLVGIGSSV